MIAFFKSSIDIFPSLSTGKYVTSNPSDSKSLRVSKTEGCSITVDIMWFLVFLFNLATLLMMVLLHSVPPDVKYISFSLAPKLLAMFLLISFISLSTSIPFLCIDEGFPY